MREQPGVDPSASPLSKRSTRKTQRDPRNNKSYKRRLEESIVKEMWNPAKVRKQESKPDNSQMPSLRTAWTPKNKPVPTPVPISEKTLQ